MAITPQQIDLWRKVPTETQRLEFKAAQTQFDRDKLNRYCVALANEGGGFLVLGIADETPRTVVGTRAFPSLIDTAEKLFESIGFRVDVEEVAHSDGRVLVFSVPSRPRGTAYHLQGAYLMRSGESLVPMSEDRLRAIFAEGQPDWLEETSRAEFDAQQIIELLDTQTFFELLKLPYPRKAPRVVVYTGASKLDTKLDQFGVKGHAVGFQGLVRFIMGQLPQNEVIEDALRKEVKLVPEVTIRELVANALIHQDLTMSGVSVMIESYSNRVEISNPGEPIVPVERFIDGYQSRNERLAEAPRCH